jgi:hypothetical protein
MGKEKVVKDLLDLQKAAATALQDGVCRIRLTSGESLVIYPAPKEEIYDVTDAHEREVVLSCMEPGGTVYSAGEAREELRRRLAAKGIRKSDAAR